VTIQAPRLALGQRVLHKEVDLQMVTLQEVLLVDPLKDVRAAIQTIQVAQEVLRQEAPHTMANLEALLKDIHQVAQEV
jgi:hypothetical protein